MHKIVYGNIEFNDKNIVSCSCNLQHALNGESLAIDTLDFEAWTGREPQEFRLSDEAKLITNDGFIFRVLTDNVNPSNLAIGTPLMYYFNNTLIGKFYIDKINRNGNDIYTFSCISSIGMLERDKHYGGIYTGQTVKTVLQELLTGIDYELDASLEDLKLYGYLPYDTKRNNLQQIQIATGLAVKTMPTGKLLISALSKDIKSNIDKSKTVIGGTFNREIPASKMILTEHKYEHSNEEEILYNEALNGTTTIIFNEPMHSLTITGGTILESGANCAKISSSGTVTLTGKKYKHLTQEISKGNSNDNVINVDKATLVTLVNSNDVLNRLYDVYALTDVIEQEIIYNYERCGDLVNVVNPYSLETEKACIKSLNITTSSFLIAKTKFIVNFVPSQPSMGYSNRIILTSGSSWIVPAGINKLRVILVGGGAGGYGGENGKNGVYVEGTSVKKGGAGGSGGVGGASGKILNTTLNVTVGQSLSYSIGQGGIGGNANSSGSVGTDTILSTLSSANGAESNEYVDIFTGDRYALIGKKGTDGGRGSNEKELGNTVNGFGPGAYGATDSMRIGNTTIYGYGGCGGGASDIANGYPGTNGRCDYNMGSGFADGGDGGNGADAGNGTNATVYGSGGNGGSGGGGGGYWGEGKGTASGYESDGNMGYGGKGGKGGNGAQGCIIIYY